MRCTKLCPKLTVNMRIFLTVIKLVYRHQQNAPSASNFLYRRRKEHNHHPPQTITSPPSEDLPSHLHYISNSHNHLKIMVKIKPKCLLQMVFSMCSCQEEKLEHQLKLEK